MANFWLMNSLHNNTLFLVPLNVAVSQTRAVVNRDSSDDVNVTCIVTGTGPSFVSWERNGRNISTDSRSSVYQNIRTENVATRISVLQLRNVGRNTLWCFKAQCHKSKNEKSSLLRVCLLTLKRKGI